MNKERGFTLVELAIVLVVIGLILGLALRYGTSVTTDAKTADTITLVKDLTAAINTFKAQYHYLPGDMPMAGNYIPGMNPVTGCGVLPVPVLGTAPPAVGDGLVDTATEVNCVAEELVRAGLIKGDLRTGQSNYGIYTRDNLTSTPNVKVLGGVLINSNNTTNPQTAPVQNIIEISNLPCVIATALDLKLDDGNFKTGKITASVNTCTVGDPTTDPVPYLDIAL